MNPYPYPYHILDFKQGDINGDGILDYVYLIGQRSSLNEFEDHIFILIQDGRTHQATKIPLKNIGGYNGQLFLGPFTSKNKLDILFSMDTGGSGRYIYAYLYTIKNNQPILIFDYDQFNGYSMYSAQFQNDFKVSVISEKKDKKFIIDVSSNKKMYIDAGVYDKNGKLLKPTDGGVLALGNLSPIIQNYNERYMLLGLQRIIGINNSDNLGAIQTYLKWDKKNFVPFFVQGLIMDQNN
ncbi:VCBS repeat-containing protein [Crassaminicella profunda]|uniref:VCBS repeat-containing protein n=1 Tax=Crassaminicella profunda TaxID=1286698 RepID=UPI001CA62B1C|nr:VCBS repeat-containing protein [Crassaminicella profunda]QZY55968.1 VCBS repeat-containing protein [Crassaminicella profunda]